MKSKAAEHTVGITELRVMVLDRLQNAERRAAPASATAAFNRANDNSQDNMMGSLLLGMLGWAPMMEAVGGMSDAFSAAAHSPLLAAAADGFSMVLDEKANKNRRRRGWVAVFKDGIYHGGRRQAGVMTAADMKKNFNLVSANENAAFAADADAEIAGMNEILDMLDRLEKEGLIQMKLSTGETVASQLNAIKAPVKNNAPRRAAAFRKAI
jgi:hypothetical protein